AVSMARVAHQLGFTTMSLYRHVASKEELLQLMWEASTFGAEELVLEGDGWRPRLRMWAIIQRQVLDHHPWITPMPLANPAAHPGGRPHPPALRGAGARDFRRARPRGFRKDPGYRPAQLLLAQRGQDGA